MAQEKRFKGIVMGMELIKQVEEEAKNSHRSFTGMIIAMAEDYLKRVRKERKEEEEEE